MPAFALLSPLSRTTNGDVQMTLEKIHRQHAGKNSNLHEEITTAVQMALLFANKKKKKNGQKINGYKRHANKQFQISDLIFDFFFYLYYNNIHHLLLPFSNYLPVTSFLGFTRPN